MKKIIIAVVLAVVLIASGLGSLVYAQEPANEVRVGLLTNWHYNVPGDDFWNGEVEGEKSWNTWFSNLPDDSGEPVNGVTLTLQSDQEFDYMNPDPDPTEPPTWSFGTVEQGSSNDVGVSVGSVSDFLTPGFDASRSANTVFTAPDTQVLTINVTPQTEEQHGYNIHVDALDYPLVNATISSVSTTEGYDSTLSWDEGYVDISVMDLPTPDTFTVTVEIQVTPNVPEVEYMPGVRVTRRCGWPDLEPTIGDSLELTTEMGTWTWSADGTYEWHGQWPPGPTFYGLIWQPLCREIIKHEPMTGQKLVGQGRYAEWEDDGIHERINTGVILTNPDCVSEITIDRISVFAYDGRLVYEGPLFKWREEIPWAEPMKPHETRISDLNQYLSGFEWPPEAPDVWMNFTVEIFWSNSDSKGLPLAGWVDTAIIRRNSEGHLIDIELAGSTEMVNMEQVLKPKD